MTVQEFKKLIIEATSGKKESIEMILRMYAPLINRSSYYNGKLDEDLKQYILIHIFKNITKFEI